MDGLTSRACRLFVRAGARATRLHTIGRESRFRQLPAALALLLIYCAFAPTSGHSQTTAVLQGVVTDRNTSQPLANVSVYNASNGVPLATTDASGSYSLTAAQLGNVSSGTLFFQLATYFAVSQPFDLTQSPTVNATLRVGGALVQGTITDAATGTPLSQAPVVMLFSCYGEPCSISQNPTSGGGNYDSLNVVTAADGTYQFDASLIIEGALGSIPFGNLVADPTGYYYANSAAFSLNVTTPTLDNFALIPIAGSTVSGLVTDRTTGAPLAGTAIYFQSITHQVATTDANGRYSIPGNAIGGASVGSLFFRAPGHFGTTQQFFVTSLNTVADQSLQAAGPYQGTVIDSTTQAPLAGVSVNYYLQCAVYDCFLDPNGYALSATTDANGHYDLDPSALNEGAVKSVDPFSGPTSISQVALYEAGYFNSSTLESIPLTAAPVTLDLSMKPSAYFVIQGSLTDRTTGAPIANANVFWGIGQRGVTAITDGNGNYSLTAAQIYNSPQVELTFQAPGYFVYATYFDVSGVAGSSYSANTTLLHGGTLIQGRVSDAATGASVDGAQVNFTGSCNFQATSPLLPSCGFLPGRLDYGNLYVGVQSGSGGLYTLDSSQVVEGSLSSLVLIPQGYVCAPAYTCVTPPTVPVLAIGQPAVQDFALTENGVTAQVTVDTNPTGLAITVDGVAAIAPQTYTWIPGNEHLISTTSPQSVTPGAPPSAYFFQWDDINVQNFAQTHIIVPPSPTYLPNPSYVAFFDTQVPTIDANIAGTLGLNGWYTSTVSLSWAEGGTQFPIISTTGCDPSTVATDTAGQSFTCTAVGVAGTTAKTVTIKRDTVAPVAATTLSPLPNGNGWNKAAVTVHFGGTDTTSGIGSCTPDQAVSTEGANQSSAPGTCTDKAGNVSATVTASGINIDLTPPVVSASVSPAPSGSGWYTVPVTVSFSGADALSGVATNGCSAPVTLSADGAGQTATGTCTDLAGNPGTGKSASINIDRTPPVASATANPPPNANGWNNGSVTVSFTGTDSLSGSGIRSCSAAVALVNQGAGQSASGTCLDVAGNTSAPATLTVNIDEALPTITVTTPSSAASYAQGSVVPAAYTCADALSGVASCAGSVANGAPLDTSTAGNHTFVVNAVDKAGNGATSSVAYLVVAASPTPVITPTVTGTLGANGWYTSNVTVQWAVSSATKILSESGCSAHTLTQNTKGTTYTCTARNAAGTTSQSVTVKRDASPPTVHASASPSANSAGWRNKPVTVTFTGSDSISGIASCTAPVILSSEGVNQSATGDCTNGAGIAGTPVTVSGISIDLTPPAVTVAVPTNGAVYARGSTVLASYTCTDALSGIKSCSAPTSNGSALPTGTSGTKTFTVTGTDLAGNTTKATISYSVK